MSIIEPGRRYRVEGTDLSFVLTLERDDVTDGGADHAPDAITVVGPPRDRAIVDVGAALGRDAARIPVAGVVTREGAPVPGAVVEAQPVYLHALDHPAGPWQEVGTTDAAGAYSGVYEHPQHPDYFGMRVRVRGLEAPTAVTALSWGAGHKIALIGQSTLDQQWQDAHNKAPYEALLEGAHAGEMIQVIHHERQKDGTGALDPSRRRHVHVAEAHAHEGASAPHVSQALASLANAFLSVRPDAKVEVTYLTLSGTGLETLLQDQDHGANPRREYGDDAWLADHAQMGGLAPFGLVTWHWFASTARHQAGFADVVAGLLTERDPIDGSPLAFPTNVRKRNHAGSVVDGDVYPRSLRALLGGHEHTRHVHLGAFAAPSGTARLLSRRLYADGRSRFSRGPEEQTQRSKQTLMQESATRLPDHPHALTDAGAPLFLPEPLSVLTHINGDGDGADAYTDTSHPASDTVWGFPYQAKLIAHGIMRALGWTSWTTPRFAEPEIEADGRFIRMRTESGDPITTTRRISGEPRLMPVKDYHGPVWGIEVNHERPGGASVVLSEGELYLYPEMRQSQIDAGRVTLVGGEPRFVVGEAVVEYIAPAAAHEPDDYKHLLPLDLPVVDHGEATPGLHGVPVQRHYPGWRLGEAHVVTVEPVEPVATPGPEVLSTSPERDAEGVTQGSEVTQLWSMPILRGDGAVSAVNLTTGLPLSGPAVIVSGATTTVRVSDVVSGGDVVAVEAARGAFLSEDGVPSAPGVLARYAAAAVPAQAQASFLRASDLRDPHFRSPPVGDGVTAVTAEIQARFPSTPNGLQSLVNVKAGGVAQWQVFADLRAGRRQILTDARDRSGTSFAEAATAMGVLPVDAAVTIRASLSFGAPGEDGLLSLAIDGTRVIEAALAGSGGTTFNPAAPLRLLFGAYEVEVLSLAAWHDADGSGEPMAAIAGPAGTANAHAWKTGPGEFA